LKNKISQKEAYAEGTDYQFIDSLQLGPWTSYSMINDPKHMCFVLARYKFVARMLEGKKKVLEMGCGDGFGLPMIAQAVSEVHGIDRDPRLIEGNKERLSFLKNAKLFHLGLSLEAPKDAYDAIFSIDVIEHLEPEKEEAFMQNSLRCLKKDGICIIGTPNATAEKHATHRSRIQHINLKGHKELKALMDRHFVNGFLFSMNDEVMHTGYYPMAHYLFAVGVGLKGNRD